MCPLTTSRVEKRVGEEGTPIVHRVRPSRYTADLFRVKHQTSNNQIIKHSMNPGPEAFQMEHAGEKIDIQTGPAAPYGESEQSDHPPAAPCSFERHEAEDEADDRNAQILLVRPPCSETPFE